MLQAPGRQAPYHEEIAATRAVANSSLPFWHRILVVPCLCKLHKTRPLPKHCRHAICAPCVKVLLLPKSLSAQPSKIPRLSRYLHSDNKVLRLHTHLHEKLQSATPGTKFEQRALECGACHQKPSLRRIKTCCVVHATESNFFDGLRTVASTTSAPRAPTCKRKPFATHWGKTTTQLTQPAVATRLAKSIRPTDPPTNRLVKK